MSTPCPLYFRPADVLAAFSGDVERVADPVPFVRRPQPIALRRVRSILSDTVRRRWSVPFRIRLGTAHRSIAACGPTQDNVDPRSAFAAAQPRGPGPRGLLSHYAMVQPSA